MNNDRSSIVISLFSFLLIISTPNLLLFDIILYPLQSYKYIFALFISSIIIFLSLNKFKFKNEDILFYLVILFIFISSVIKLDIKNIIFSFYSIFFVLLISQFTLSELKKLLMIIVAVLAILSIMGIFQVFLYTFFGYDNYITLIIRSIDSVKNKGYHYSFFTLLGGADSFYNFKGILIPRFSGYVDQSSAISIIMLFPAALYLIFIKELKVLPIIIIFFSIFCLGMSTYLCLLLTFILFICKRNIFVSTRFFIFGPLVAFFLLISFLYLRIISVNYGDDLFQKYDLISNNLFLDYIHGKLSSGIARISIISGGVDNFINYPWFGIPSTINIGFGLIFLSYGQNYGFLSALVIILIFVKIIRMLFIFYNKNINCNNHTLFGIFLFYSIFIELILYNDYAASRLWGLIFFFIAYRLFYLSFKVQK